MRVRESGWKAKDKKASNSLENSVTARDPFYNCKKEVKDVVGKELWWKVLKRVEIREAVKHKQPRMSGEKSRQRTKTGNLCKSGWYKYVGSTGSQTQEHPKLYQHATAELLSFYLILVYLDTFLYSLAMVHMGPTWTDHSSLPRGYWRNNVRQGCIDYPHTKPQ